MSKRIHINLHTDSIRYITDPQEHTTNNSGRAKNELINQGVKTADVQYYNTHQESIIQLQKVISTTFIVMHQVLTGRLRGNLKPIQRS